MLTDGPRAARVLIGFLAARTMIGSPLDVPPFDAAGVVGRPAEAEPAVVARVIGLVAIGSITFEPGLRAASMPRPISTPLIAWMLITAAASRASSLRSHWVWLPSPIGHPVTIVSMTPPSVSPASCAASIAATIAGSACGFCV